MTFKENFRQGLVVEIDVQNQMVLLEDGEVSVAGAEPTLSWLREAPRKPQLLVGGDLGGLKGADPSVAPTWCRLDGTFLTRRGLATAATGVWWQPLLRLSCTPGTVLSLLNLMSCPP